MLAKFCRGLRMRKKYIGCEMRFRDLKEFNKALLEKHCWRPMKEKKFHLESVFKHTLSGDIVGEVFLMPKI